MRPKLFLTLTVGVLTVACFLLFLTCFTVRVTECAVVLTWENPKYALVGTKGDAGLHVKWPWPIETVEKFDARTHVFSTKPEQTLTKDSHSLIATVSTGWRIAEPIQFREKVGTVEKAQNEHLEGLVRTYTNAVIAKHPLNHLVSVDPRTLAFDKMEKQILTDVGAQAADKYGITVEFTKIKQLNLPKSVVEQVFKRMRDERERIAVDIREKGEQEAKKIRAEADRYRTETVAAANAEAKRLMGEGDAEAAKYYEVFAKDEDLAIFLRKLEALKKTLKKRATVILTTEDQPYDLFEEGWKGNKR